MEWLVFLLSLWFRKNPVKLRTLLLDKFLVLGSVPFRHIGDLLLICPPFAGIRPSLGLHIIETIALNEGLSASVLYANLSLASFLGEKKYLAVNSKVTTKMAGEFLFSRFAFPQHMFDPARLLSSIPPKKNTTQSIDLHTIEKQIPIWLDSFRLFIRKTEFSIYGLSTMFAQNLSSACMAKIIKEEKPAAKIIIGGANCAGIMSRGIKSICPEVDFIFSGESELTFLSFCKNYRMGKFPKEMILHGQPNDYWKALPHPSYHTFFDQLQFWLPKSQLAQKNQIPIPYETSRGCWWGQKNHCKFCGLNNDGITFRAKNSSLVFKDILKIAETHPAKQIAMTDNIMPLSYFKDLIPQLKQAKPNIEIFYEQKSNLKRDQLVGLRDANILTIQPGIEALSTNLLKKMSKGVSAAQNVAILRDCRSLGITVRWNILYGIPEESLEDFKKTIALIPLLVHLDPPTGCSKVSFDRFSPYFNDPEKFGIKNLRPDTAYFKAYPEDVVPINNIAYHFIGDIQSIETISPSTLKKLQTSVKRWIGKSNKKIRPILCVAESDKGLIVIDTRFSNKPLIEPMDEQTANLITSNNRYSGTEPSMIYNKKWAIQMDGLVVGLASTISDKLFANGIISANIH